jgi:hypothetical protein
MWIEGIYDAADSDYIVLIVTCISMVTCSTIVPTTLGSETAASGHEATYDVASPLRSLEKIAADPVERYERAQSSRTTRGSPQWFVGSAWRDRSP